MQPTIKLDDDRLQKLLQDTRRYAERRLGTWLYKRLLANKFPFYTRSAREQGYSAERHDFQWNDWRICPEHQGAEDYAEEKFQTQCAEIIHAIMECINREISAFQVITDISC